MTDKVEGSPKTSHEQEEEPENADKTEIHQKLSDYATRVPLFDVINTLPFDFRING